MAYAVDCCAKSFVDANGIPSSELFNPKRKRTFYVCKPKKIPKKIKINEGKKFGLFSYNQLKKLRVVPFDFSAISYHYFSEIKKIQILPKK